MNELNKRDKGLFKLSFVLSLIISVVVYFLFVGFSWLMTLFFPNVNVWLGGLILSWVYISCINAKNIATVLLIQHKAEEYDDESK